MGILTTATDARRFDLQKALALSMTMGAPGPWRQLPAIAALGWQTPRFTVQEYFAYALYRRSHRGAARRSYVTISALTKFNMGLARGETAATRELLRNKFQTELFMRARGLPFSRTLAVFGRDRPEAGEAQHLPDQAALERFLRECDSYPLFGKPVDGSFSSGAVGLAGIDRNTGDVDLTNGHRVPLALLAREIADSHPGGYLLQIHARNHTDLRRIAGQATSSLRLATILQPDGPRLFYAVQKLPSVSAMHDAPSVNARLFLGVDPDRGVVNAAHVPGRMPQEAPKVWQDPATPVIGFRIPHFDRAVSLALAAHQALPEMGVLGTDILVTQEGPILNEINFNPDHVNFQYAFDRGLLSGRELAMVQRRREMLTKPGA